MNSKKHLFIFVRFLVEAVQSRVNAQQACHIQNIIMRLFNKQVRYAFEQSLGCYLAVDGNIVKHFPDQKRGFRLYFNGIPDRGRSILESYRLSTINFKPTDIIVDCGANYGDLFIELAHKMQEHNYFAFEPSPSEYNCLVYNYKNANIFRVALSNENGTADFFLNTESADSSLVKPSQYSHKLKVECRKLDEINQIKNIASIKLLKVEAEGFEPEILQGSLVTLKKCEYVAVDGGFERGEDQEETFTAVTNLLISAGFEIVEINFQMLRSLYRNKSFKCDKNI